MNISLENVSKVSAELTVIVEADDYKSNVEKEIKRYCREAQIPGFRKGKVPRGIIEREMGMNIKVRAIDELLQKNIPQYIQDNNIQMLGQPVASSKEGQAQFNDEEIKFIFDIALAPEFDLQLSKSDVLPFYNVAVSDDEIESQIKSIRGSEGKMIDAETYAGDRDMLKGKLVELDAEGNALEGGLSVEDVSVMPTYFKADEQKKLFEGVCKGDVVVFNPSVAYSEYELAQVLKVSKEDAASHNGNFSYEVASISHFQEAELSQEIYDRLFGEGVVKNEEELHAKLSEQIEAAHKSYSESRFNDDLQKYLMDKVGKLVFADDLLKKIMIQSEEKKTAEQIEEQYPKSIEALTWHLIQEKLVKAYDIKVNNDELTEMAKSMVRYQFAQYGMANASDEMLKPYVDQQLKNESSVNRLVESVISNKICKAALETVTLETKDLTMAEFNDLYK